MAGLRADWRPDYAHVPGANPRHPDGTFDAIRDSALQPTTSSAAAANPAFQAGLNFLETGYFWEAHEVLEPVWMNAQANSPERFMVQALIQIANAALKRMMARPKAAQRLCMIARDLLDRAGAPDKEVMGLRVAALHAAIVALEDAPTDPDAIRVRVRR